jgi:hypothetical protein
MVGEHRTRYANAHTAIPATIEWKLWLPCLDSHQDRTA